MVSLKKKGNRLLYQKKQLNLQARCNGFAIYMK